MTENLTIEQIVGNNIRTARTKARLTQKELGELVGIKQQQIMRYEKGEQGMYYSRLREIERVLKLKCGQLLKNT